MTPPEARADLLARFPVGARVTFQYGAREVEATVTELPPDEWSTDLGLEDADGVRWKRPACGLELVQ